MTEVQHVDERRTIAPSVGRASAALFLISLLLLGLYVLGGLQSFVDATMRWLLRMLEIALVLSAAFALCSCFLYALHALAGRWRFAAAPAALSLLVAVMAFALLASVRMVAAVIGGPPLPGPS